MLQTWCATFLLLAADARASGILLPNGRCALVDEQLYADAMWVLTASEQATRLTDKSIKCMFNVRRG